ncbi:MAG TPA: hypothetical protein VHV80_10655 [Steroidobacteraceae bacterium]|nr:hypothetical protein [Steroidobacteraceae bacterium]
MVFLPPSSRGLLLRGERRDGDLIAEYGSDGSYDYAVVSRAGRGNVRGVQAAVSAVATS